MYIQEEKSLLQNKNVNLPRAENKKVGIATTEELVRPSVRHTLALYQNKQNVLHCSI